MIASRAIAVCVGHPAAMRLQQPALRRAASRQQAGSFLPTAIFVLKLVASLLAGATITLVLWPEHRKPATPSSVEADRFVAAFSQFGQDNTQQGSIVYRAAPQRTQRPAGTWETETLEAALDREIPSNFPRRVQTVRFTPPPAHQPLQPVAPSISNVLSGKPLRYLIGTDASGPGRDNEVTVVSYSTARPAKHGVSIAYCNLFDEHNTGKYGPYLKTSDTAAQYNEGQIDPRGPGWEKNLREQFERRKKQGFEYVELDNPDAYTIKDVIGAIELASSYGLKVIAKNPGLMGNGATAYVAHPNVYGIIVEKGAGTAKQMDDLRRKAGKPELPTWFVAFGSGRKWAGSVASTAKNYRNMGVTYSSAGEYGNAIDILPPS